MKAKSWLLIPLVAMTLAACGGKTETADNSGAAAPAPSAKNNVDVVRVAVEPVYPPFVQPLPEGGFEGYDIEVLKAAGEKGGFSVSFMPYPWTGLMDRLNTGEVDIVAGGLSVTEERQAKFDFSVPYSTNSVVLAVPPGSPIKTFNDVRGKRVTYQSNTNEMNVLQKFQGAELDKNLSVDSAWLGFKSVLESNQGQKADATIGSLSSMKYYAGQYKDMGITLITDSSLPVADTAFMVKKGNTELLSKLNKGLEAIKADGTLKKIQDKWIAGEGHVHSASEAQSH